MGRREAELFGAALNVKEGLARELVVREIQKVHVEVLESPGVVALGEIAVGHHVLGLANPGVGRKAVDEPGEIAARFVRIALAEKLHSLAVNFLGFNLGQRSRRGSTD